MPDKYLWLENLESTDALHWVDKQNQSTLSEWAHGNSFNELKDRSLQFLNQKDRLTIGTVLDKKVYHLWKDSQNPLGLFRVAELSTLSSQPNWKIIFDLDQYSKEQGVPTFLNHFDLLENGERVLLYLSPEGKDARVIREWDLGQNKFVENGFQTKLSKDSLTWIDQDQVLLSSTQAPTHCGYSSEIYLWSRGQEPKLIYKVPSTSMSAWAFSPIELAEQGISIIGHQIDWNHTDFFIFQNEMLIATGFPQNSSIMGVYQKRFVLWREKEWDHFPKDSILVAKKENHFTNLTSADFEIVFRPHPNSHFQRCSVYHDGIAIYCTENLKHKIKIWRAGQLIDTPVSENQTISHLFSSLDRKQLFSVSQSPTQPATWFQYHEEKWNLIQSTSTQFNIEGIKTKQEWAVSADGTKVPYVLIFNSNFSFPRPTLQYGYGGFLSSIFPVYQPEVGSLWLEKGGVYILSQIRGGAEFGADWHQAAVLKNKQKSYDDFIAISEDLIRKGYTTSKMLAIQGRSNGGLLVGAVAMQRPELYQAAVIEVPLLDMIRYVELPPGSSWVGEYGDPRDPEFYSEIIKYSPYQNINPDKKYPKILIRTSRSDDRVHPGHARKMAAKLQEYGHECWFYEEALGGHGSTPVQVKAEQLALIYEFLWKNLILRHSL